MPAFDVHFDDETMEALRRQICATVDEVSSRADITIGPMSRAILMTRLMVEVEEKLFELRSKNGE